MKIAALPPLAMLWMAAGCATSSAPSKTDTTSAAKPAKERPPDLPAKDPPLPAGRQVPGSTEKEEAVLKQIQLLNQVPEEQLSEKTDPGFSIIKKLYDLDSPDFLTLRKLLGKAEVRAPINASARCVLAGIVSQRWDTFTLAGNLWLSGLRSPNPELRAKARSHLVGFVQTAHIPSLIDTLKIPGPNVLAYDVLKEITGNNFDPDVKVWQGWWAKSQGTFDLVGHLLKDTQEKLDQRHIRPFDQDKFWYLPEGIRDAHLPYAQRSADEQTQAAQWNDWANDEVKRYVDTWAEVKPILDRIVHQPDPRVNAFLAGLVPDPGFGDYASVVLAWRADTDALPLIRGSYQKAPTVSRALARGSLGDRTALVDLLHIIGQNPRPLSYGIMEDSVRTYAQTVHTLGILPAEQAFELLTHHVFELDSAATAAEKAKATKKAKAWLLEQAQNLTFDRRRGYYVPTGPSHESLAPK